MQDSSTPEPVKKTSKGVGFSRWVLRGLVVSVALVMAAAVAGGAYLSRTDAGRAWVLNRAVGTAESRLNGTVEVGSLGPTGLLGGATLRDVVVRTPDGSEVFSADSVSGRYSIRELLGGTSAIADLQLFSPRFVVEPAEGGGTTVQVLLEQPEDTTVAVDTTLVQSQEDSGFRIRGARIHDGQVHLKVGATERLISGINAEFGRVELPNQDGDIEGSLSEFALEVPLGVGTARLADATGRVVVSDQQVMLELGRVELPDSRASGTVFVEWRTGRLVTTADLMVDRVAMADLAWISPRFDHGFGQGRTRLRIDDRGTIVVFDGTRVDLGDEARLALDGELAVRNGGLVFRDLSAKPSRFPTTEVNPWLEEPLPVEGRVSGTINLDGPADRLAADGQIALLAGEADTLAVAVGAGRFSRGNPERMTVHLNPVRYDLFQAWVPALTLNGSGYVHVEAEGALPTGMAVQLSAEQRVPGFPDSQVRLAGTLFGDSTISLLDLEGTVSPLSFSALQTGYPDIPLSGEVSGSVSFSGPLEELRMGIDVETIAGPVEAVATFNAQDPSAGYSIAGSVEEFILSDLVPAAPTPTVLTGAVQAQGSGFDATSIQGGLQVSLRSSRVSSLRVDSVEANVWVDEDGRLNVEHLYAATEAGTVEATGGQLGVAPGSRGSGLEVAVNSPSIAPLRPFIMGDSLVARDELTEMELSFLVEFDGVDPDTLPTLEEIRFQGSLHGDLTFSGGLDDLTVDADLTGDSLAYRIHSAGHAVVAASIEGLALVRPDSAQPAPVTVRGTANVDSLSSFDRTFHTARVEGSWSTDGRSRALAVVQRTANEEYEAQGVIQWAEGAGVVNLDRFTMRFPDTRWNLRGPASFEWRADEIVVNDFGVTEQGGDGFRLSADGRIARGEGTSDFSLEATNVDLGVLGRVGQVPDAPEGVLSVDLEVAGSSQSPEAAVQFLGEDLSYRAFGVDRLTGSGTFGGRALQGEVEAWTDGRMVLRTDGVGPLQVGLEDLTVSVPEGPLDLRIVADSLPLSLALGAIQGLEALHGHLDGEVSLGGSPSDVVPGGGFTLAQGAAYLPGLGINILEGEAQFDLQEDGTVVVDGSGRSEGTIDVRGSVGLEDLRNPTFDLAFWPNEFQAVARRDVVATVSGDSITLGGAFRFPLVLGDVRVDEGTVFLEEFERASEAVSFYDPFFLEALRSEQGDSEVELEGRNPFLQNLRVIVGMTMDRGSWLRSREMNVETAGDLNVTFSRAEGSLVLQGDVRAVRGTYTVASRAFTVTEGTFQFVGTPGFNPNVTIRAENRLQVRDGLPLTVIADLSGTLLGNLQLALSSDAEVAVSEADLLSYLLLGQPTSALVNETGATAGGVGLNLALGQVANQLGYLLAPTLTLDHLSVSQAQQGGSAAALGMNGTLQLEAGRYVKDVFLLLRYQRGACADPSSLQSSWGFRGEMELSEGLTLESFLDDRCARDGFRGLGDLSFELSKIWGFSLFKQWGY